MIYSLYSDYIAQSGILRVEPIGDVLTDASLNSQSLPVGHEYSRRLSAGSFESVLEALSFEIRPTFDYPEIIPEKPHDIPAMIFCLVETLLMFVLYPKMAKFVGYELANRIRCVMLKVDPLGWSTYVNNTGFIHGRPGVDQAISRNEYLNNGQRPSIFYQGARNVWGPMRHITELILPFGSRRNRERARAAGLPIFDESIFVPWDDPGDEVYGESQLTNRIRSILMFVQTDIVTRIKRHYLQSASIISAVCNILLAIADRAPRAGNGLGRGMHRLFCGMTDFGTNVIHSYDGVLSTDLPQPLGVFDDAGIRVSSLPVQSTTSSYLVDT